MTYRHHRSDNSGKEPLVKVAGFGYLPSTELRPSERHQIQEEFIRYQREFASEIYIQRCKEKDL